MDRVITNDNFHSYFPIIKTVLEQSDFIALDAEFTGISSNSLNKNSLFDTSNERYLTVKSNIKDFIISQVGITAFRFNRDTNTYAANTFVFYVYPRTVGSLQRTFLVESTAFEFLARYDFDFNQFIKHGVGYLSNADEAQITRDRDNVDNATSFNRTTKIRQNGPVLVDVDPITKEEEDAIGRELDRVASRLTLDSNEVFLEGEVWTKKVQVIQMLKENIQKQCPTVVMKIAMNTEDNEMGCVYQRADSGESPNTIALNKCLGFSLLFKLLIKLKKPLVGHNPLLDLMLIYNQFQEDLPNNLDIFKQKINTLFPLVYDTKHISYELREVMDRERKWESNDLSKLYVYFHSGHGLNLVGHTPSVMLANTTNAEKDKQIVHEAGWDSYYTGYCFIRMMHYFAVQNNYGCGMDAKPLTSTQHLHSVRTYKNCVNISRANIGHIRLDGPDPQSEKPQWLVLESVKNSLMKQSDVSRLAADCVNASLDIKWVSSRRALIATTSRAAARQMRAVFNSEKGYQLQEYSPQKHNPFIRAVLWSGAVAVCVGTVLLFKLRPRIS